jgi:hypothetical protein
MVAADNNRLLSTKHGLHLNEPGKELLSMWIRKTN